MFSLEKRRLRGSQLLSSTTNIDALKRTGPGFSQNAQQESRRQWSQVEGKEITSKYKNNMFPMRRVKYKSGLPRRLWDLQTQKFKTQAKVSNSLMKL